MQLWELTHCVLTLTLKISAEDFGMRCRHSGLWVSRKQEGFSSDTTCQEGHAYIFPSDFKFSQSVFQANASLSQINFILRKVLHNQILFCISILKLNSSQDVLNV